MIFNDRQKTYLIDLNKKEYGDRYKQLSWLSDADAEHYSNLRNSLLEKLGNKVLFGYKNTKLDCRNISPGCQTCGEGTWSCLFINEDCNCRCFYCPAEQRKNNIPTTNTLEFPDVKDYADYISVFGFKGVGISGGEPLLSLKKTLKFISWLHKIFGDNVYIWMYTNGTLITKDILLQLQNAGLNEIRFDIGATHYNLEKASLAVGIIDNVTIEIPAVPEDFELLKQKLIEMENAGIHFLNIHQLRLTPHNFSNLVKRNYTFLHGQKVTVLESELMAINLINYTLEHGINIPVNYCSFVYKNQFQRAAARKRSALVIKKSHEDITENGYIRYLCLAGNEKDLADQTERFRKHDCDNNLWFLKPSANRLYFSPVLWEHVQSAKARICLGYYESAILPAVTYRHQFQKIALNPGKTVIVEKGLVGNEIVLTDTEMLEFENTVIRKNTVISPGTKTDTWNEILAREFIREGLQEYF